MYKRLSWGFLWVSRSVTLKTLWKKLCYTATGKLNRHWKTCVFDLILCHNINCENFLRSWWVWELLLVIFIFPLTILIALVHELWWNLENTHEFRMARDFPSQVNIPTVVRELIRHQILVFESLKWIRVYRGVLGLEKSLVFEH